MTASSSSSFEDYSILPVRLPSDKRVKQAPHAVHYMYVRKHEPSAGSFDALSSREAAAAKKTLFMVNVPIDATLTHFRAVFSELVQGAGGVIEGVTFPTDGEGQRQRLSGSLESSKAVKKRKREDALREEEAEEEAASMPRTWDRQLHRSGGTALVTFVDSTSLDSVLRSIRKATKSGKKKSSSGITEGVVSWGGEGVDAKTASLGSKRYLRHQRLQYPPSDELQSSVDAYMTLFAQKETEETREAARLRSEPDEDGFVTVTRGAGGRSGPARREEARLAVERENERKRRRGDLKDFYRFQVREERKKKQIDLVRKFEADKQKVNEMKKQRGRFRPE